MLGESSTLENKTHLSKKKTWLGVRVKYPTVSGGTSQTVGRHAKKHDRSRLEKTFGPYNARLMPTQLGRYCSFLGCIAGRIR